jgi:hypothetical protein
MEPNKMVFTPTDRLIIGYLKAGYTQKSISGRLLKDNGVVYSMSYIEKRLKAIRVYYGANTMFHLGCILTKENL